jgi:hypothetical protein
VQPKPRGCVCSAGPTGEELLQRIVLTDETGQLHQRIRSRARLLRLGRPAQLALEIVEIEGESVSSWLAHDLIHSSACRHPSKDATTARSI